MSGGSLYVVPRPCPTSASRIDLRAPYAKDRPAVSVIIGSFQGAETIGATLRSLAGQTLPRGLFEVVVVQNGPPDHTAKIVAEIREEQPGFVVRYLYQRTPGLGRARNSGMSMARGSYVTFVDDDDTVSPGYLQGLLECSRPDTVGVAVLADVDGTGGAPNFDNRLADQLALAGSRVDPGQAISALTYSVGKLLPTALARAIGFDPDLRSGEDIPFYLRFFMTHGLAVRFVPLERHAVYYRTVVPGSLSRQAPSYDFNVTQRLDVIERLEAMRPTEDWHRVALRERTKSQTRAINRYLLLHPDQEVRVLCDIQDRGLTTVPLDVMTAGVDEAAKARAEAGEFALAG